jgi:hypothetical protein
MAKDVGTITRIQKGKKTDLKIASGDFKRRVLTQGKRTTDKENKNILFRALSNRVKTEVRIYEVVRHVELHKRTFFSKTCCEYTAWFKKMDSIPYVYIS